MTEILYYAVKTTAPPKMNQPVQPPTTLNISSVTGPSTKYLDLARKIKEIEMVKF
jgi:hypothetical protein